MTTLHEAARLGLTYRMLVLLDDGADINAADDNGSTPLHYAAKSGSIEAVMICLENRANVSALDSDGRTHLHYATEAGSSDIISACVKYGADIHATDESTKTCLYYAVRSGSHRAVSACLEHNGDVNKTDDKGRACLHYAAEVDQAATVLYLLKLSANIEQLDEDGNSPLHVAARSGHANIVQLLIDSGANVIHSNKDSHTALYCAVQAGSIESVRVLLDTTPTTIDLADKDKRTPLLLSATTPHSDITRILMERGAGIHHVDKFGKTALHLAAEAKIKDSIRLLLDRDANIHRTDNVGHTALHKAARASSSNCVRLLLDRGADIRHADEFGRTALHEAAKAYSSNCIEMLLDRDANIHQTDKVGRTALHEATRACSTNCIRLLLDRGADVLHADEFGRTALHEAAKACSNNCVQILLDRGAMINQADFNGRTALHDATQAGSEDVIQTLLGKGATVTIIDNKRRTVLHEAVVTCSFNGVDELLSRGAASIINEKDEMENSPLHEAVRKGDFFVVSLLLNRGADVTTKNVLGRTVLHECAQSISGMFIQKLVNKGADANAVDKFGETPLMVALKSSNVVQAVALIQAGAETNIPWNRQHAQSIFKQATDKWTELNPKLDHFSLSKLMIMCGSDDKDHASAYINQDVQYHIYEWELPKVILQTAGIHRLTGINLRKRINNFIRNTITLTGSDGYFQYNTCEEFMSTNWDAIGLSILHAVVLRVWQIWNSGSKTHNIHDTFDIERYDLPVNSLVIKNNYIAFKILESQPGAKEATEAFQWLCSAFRILPESSDYAEDLICNLQKSEVSRNVRSARGHQIVQCSLEKLVPLSTEDVGPNNCWTQLFRSGIVAWWPICKEWGKGLELPFSTLVDMAAVENYTFISQDQGQPTAANLKQPGGYILVGFFTALIPTAYQAESNSIQWHLHCSDDLLDLRKLPLSEPWAQLSSQTICEASRCFLGWGDPVNILLGTKHAEYGLRWSRSNEHTSVRRAEGPVVGFEFGLRDILPAKNGIAVERVYKTYSTVQRFSRQDQYDKAVMHLSRQVGFVYDTATQRAWLVPLLSLMLHLCHVYFANFNVDNALKDPIPFADSQPDGAQAAAAALRGKEDKKVFDNITLGNVLLSIYWNFQESAKTRQDPTGTTIFAAEAMNQLDEPLTGSPLKSKKLGHGSNAWLSLVRLADFVCFCANLGTAMQPHHQDPSQQCDCHILPSDKFLLAAHNSCLKILVQRKGGTLEDLQDGAWEISEKEILALPPVPDTKCDHDPGRPFWSDCVPYLQTSRRGRMNVPAKKRPKLDKTPTETGAVVFGPSKEMNLVSRLFSR